MDNLLTTLSAYQGQTALITDETVASCQHKVVQQILQQLGAETICLVIPSGERAKTRAQKEQIEDELMAKGLSRDLCLIALGGGVISDLVGFVAATYGRGVPWVAIPTTLLAMVDASLGGKVGVNTPYAKNMIGAFHPPEKVLVQLEFLTTLPTPQMQSGLAEIIKYALIASRELFTSLENEKVRWVKRDRDLLEEWVQASCAIKLEVVAKDLHDHGRRHVLNLGHTVGHALETCTCYQMSHGEAIALGMRMETALSQRLGFLTLSEQMQIETLFTSYGFPSKLPAEVTLDKLMTAMRLDKKSVHGQPRFVLLSKIGEPTPFDGAYCTAVDPELLREIWHCYK